MAADENYNISEKQVDKLSSELITETILRLDNVLCSMLKDEKVIHSIDLIDSTLAELPDAEYELTRYLLITKKVGTCFMTIYH